MTSFYRPSAARRIPAALAPTLSRRSFLALASSILACQETQPRTDGASLEDSAIDTPARQRPAIDHRRRRAVRPRLTVSIAPLPPTLHRQAERWVARLRRSIPTHWDLVCTATGQGLFRLFATHGNPEHPVVGGRSFVPVTSHDNLAPGLSRAELRALLAGAIENWRALGHPENLTVHRASFEFDGFRLPVPHARYRDVGSLGRTIEPGFFALVEPHAVEPRLRVLAIEGVDPFRAPRGAPVTPELVEWLVVEGPLELLPESGRRAEAIPAPVYGTITFVGDIILGRTVHRIMSTRSDWASPFRLVAEELRWSDLTIGNLECALTDRYAAPSDPHTLRFLTLPRAVEGLQLAGIDAVSLANNHSLDFGWLALEDTRRTLDGVGIRTFGVGDYLEEALDPVFLHAGTALVALLGFDGIAADWSGATERSPGTAPLRPEQVEKAVRAARQRADIVIPFMHWGTEYTLVPNELQRAVARLAIDAGATLVVGSHPHWVQGVEWYRGCPIFYSLGNFVFDQEWSPETKQGLILHLWFRGSTLVRYELVPVVIEDFHRPRIATEDERRVILERVRRSSRALAP